MLFNSYVFWLFQGLVLLVYWRLSHRQQNGFLLLASYVFYSAWDWRFLSLILLSTVVDYLASHRIHRSTGPRQRRAWLALSLGTNLGLLGLFKYFDFFVAELAALAAAAGLQWNLQTLGIVLPVGISFYTFQTLGYTVDVYRRQVAPARSPLDFALYVAFFPQLVAGPIERSARLLPQMQAPRRWRRGDFAAGLDDVLMGLFKKVAVADNLAPIVNHIFAAPPGSLSAAEVMLGVYAFAIQIYCDFSGYSSIARGVARWMGFDLMRNFACPYRARSPQEFWRRWHISLSTWLRDYLYVPLGGNRGGRLATYRNLLLTMLLGGLWHGAAWTFIVWGALHGGWLGVHRALSARPAWVGLRQAARRLWPLLSVLATFHLVCLGWLYFRAESTAQAATMLGRLGSLAAGEGSFAMSAGVMLAFFALPLLVYEAWQFHGGRMVPRLPRHGLAYGSVLAYALGMLLLFPAPRQNEFIYFQF